MKERETSVATQEELIKAFERELPGCICEPGMIDGNSVTNIFWPLPEGFMKMHVHHRLIEDANQFASTMCERISAVATLNEEEL